LSSSSKLYSSLAPWFHLLTSPADYTEEAEFIRATLVAASPSPVRTVLELGSGGGNNASHLKAHFQLTLADVSREMLELSRVLNPECEHIVGDMRSMRLDREFDAVLIQDAIMYMTTPDQLRACMQTAFDHCRTDGVALLLPDMVKEKFVSGVHHGGRDGESRSLRFIEWTYDSDPSDSSYTVDFALLLREGSGPVRVDHDHHVFGLFSRNTWLHTLVSVGFTAGVLEDPSGREVFLGLKPAK
jgi:SAM-dependent methyltransferase